MTESVVESFDALAGLVGDDFWSAQFKKRVAAALAAKPEDRAALLAAAYFDAERQIVKRSDGRTNEEAVRAKAAPLFEKTADRYPGLPLLCLPPERQFLALANALVRVYASVWNVFAGGGAVAKAMRASLAGSPWEQVEASADLGLKYDPLRMRTLNEEVEAFSRLFEGWFEAAAALFGEEANRRAFEKAFRRLEPSYGFVPAFKNLLGATPLKVLGHEKARRLHDLERETVLQARDIRSADMDLRRRAEELHATVQELQSTRQKLEIVSKARSEFIDVVSHQFRTPLSSIRWNAEILVDAASEGSLDPQYREPIENVRAKSVYLIETLDRVFASLEIDSGTMVIDRKPAFLWEVVQDVYGLYAKDMERRRLKWKFNRTEDQLREISIDKNKIAAALRIVIGNAVGYNKEGGGITVDLTTEKTNGRVYQVCTVKDDGVGIPKDDQARVVEKFFRAKPAILRAPDGTGLGMYIVQHYVEAHQGSLSVESPGVDKGTAVSIALPLE